MLWLWPDSQLDEAERAALAMLLTALGTFGRAESWCEAELLGEGETQTLQASAGLINSHPFDQTGGLAGKETIRLLMPREELKPEELLKALETETSAMRKDKQLEPTGTRWLTYSRPAGILTPRRFSTGRVQGKTKMVTVARFALDSKVLPRVTDALPFAEQARRALILFCSQIEHSETITGKTVDGVPLDGHEHAHYFATDEDGDGRLDHLTVYAARGFVKFEQDALGELRMIDRRENSPNVKLVLTGLGTVEQMPDVRLFGQPTKTKWRSVTPFSLPRFANRGGGKPPRPRDLPEAQLVRELKSRGKPEPISIKPVDGYEAGGRPLVRWLEFHARRFKGDEGFGLAGFELEFVEPVAGPLALGFGCHFGLGLFWPV